MPEPKELSTSAALETLRGWSALERERAASAPNIELQSTHVERLMHLWCKARARVCESDHPNEPIDALLEFGSAAREAGFQPRVDALDGGSDEYRRVAVAFVQLALSGGRELLIQFVQEIRVTGRGYDALALAHDIVFHEVLPIARPPRVPNGWEGRLPDREVRTVEDLLAWFDQQLEVHLVVSGFPNWTDDGAVLRNARRLMDELRIDCDTQRAVGQLSRVEVENQLRDLMAVCRRHRDELPPKGKRGRRPKHNAKKDAEFQQAWQSAKASGVCFKDFCKDREKTTAEGDKILARVRSRKK